MKTPRHVTTDTSTSTTPLGDDKHVKAQEEQWKGAAGLKTSNGRVKEGSDDEIKPK